MADNTETVLDNRAEAVRDSIHQSHSLILDAGTMRQRIMQASIEDRSLAATSAFKLWDSNTREGPATRDAANPRG